nr:hypothetical protein [Tanacetum cinerariifolium]
NLYKLLHVHVMVTVAIFVFADSLMESFRDTIKIYADVTHPVPVTLAFFLASIVMMRLDQHGKAIWGIQENLLEVPIQEELRAPKR